MRGWAVASSAEQQHQPYELHHPPPIPTDFYRGSPKESTLSWLFLRTRQIYPNEIIHSGIKWPGAECRRAINVIIESSSVPPIYRYKSLYTQSIPTIHLQSPQLEPGKETRNVNPYEERCSQASSHLGAYYPPRPDTHEHLSCTYQQEVQSAASLLS